MWDDLAAWFQSPGGARVLQTAIIPALAILVAGLLAALIARSAVRATIRRAERVEAASAVAGLVAAARATVDQEGDGGSRRRAARLRTEADVRTRLLPLPGSDLAADWAAARTDALAALPDGTAVAAALGELRDRLVEWVEKPTRARRIFTATAAPSAPPAAPVVAAPAEPEAVVAAPEPPAPEPEAEAEAADQDRFARPGPRRTSPEPTPQPELVAAAAAVTPSATSVPVGLPAPLGETVPAWQRTRAVERLQQERGRTRGVESPTTDVVDDEVPLSTAPVTLARAHRAEGQQSQSQPAPPEPEPDVEEAVRLEAHQQARHARPTDAVGTSTGAAPTATPAPAWLDTYDDEAQVTQNLDLKTPPPVAATAVRDRGTPGEDLVPRS